ncbi:MAG: tRNA (adenosine(37)-N6)-dimethylallyltransferase MiaA [Clostridia bacterium]|nr:tRNA (adenosine(37)-N6)-dimethylallyltransferase MiaA [Clostridia bacterium]
MKPELIIICGATASGKSQLALDVAKKLNTSIVYADSLAIYKDLDIGTAKPTKQEMEEVKHYLVDFVPPTSEFSVSDYEMHALTAINEILSQNKPVVICGGTGFYINSILYKLSYGNTAKNEEVRQKYMEMASSLGVDAVYNELQKVDSETASKLHKNDVVRVVRALEIYYATGKKKSHLNDTLTPRFSYIAVSIDMPRNVLYERINLRVDKMVELGLVDEVKNLIKKGITIENQCMQGIGYKEIYEGLNGGNLDDAIETIKLNSRHYAKRQITFFKRMQGLVNISGNRQELLDKVLELYNNYNS